MASQQIELCWVLNSDDFQRFSDALEVMPADNPGLRRLLGLRCPWVDERWVAPDGSNSRVEAGAAQSDGASLRTTGLRPAQLDERMAMLTLDEALALLADKCESAGLRPEDLAAVDSVLTVPPGARVQFYVSRRGSLAGLTPLEAIAAGQLTKVIDAAQAYAQG